MGPFSAGHFRATTSNDDPSIMSKMRLVKRKQVPMNANPLITPAELRLAHRRTVRTKHERNFAMFWSLYGGHPLIGEYRFHASRKWRFDFADPDAKVAIELHGAVWAQGRHTRGSAFQRDREKMYTAAELGWLVYELTEKDIHRGMILRIKKQCDLRKAAKGAIP